MILNVKVKASSGKQTIEDFGNHRYLVYLKSAPEHDKANIELINLFSKYFCVPAKNVRIKFGMHSHEKVIEIN